MTSRPLPPPAAAAAVHSHRHSRSLLLLIFSVAFPAALLLVLVLLLFLYFFFSHRRSPTLPFDSPVPPRLRRFSYRDLRAATSGFDPSCSLGRGASAAVFRGVLADGKSVAVKRLDPLSSPTAPSSVDREFQNELQILANLQPSPFVVSLLGYCLEGNRHRLLVYEYMSNGSLQEVLFGTRCPHIDWNRRFRIISDVAESLAFLHLHCDPPVIHGDIKPSNVLLGPDFQAKISDFGLSRLKNEIELCPSQELCPSHELFAGSPQVDFSLAILAPSSSNPCINQDKKMTQIGVCGDDPNTGGNQPLGKDWWWKQEESGEVSSRDYVREWVGSQISPVKNPDWEDDRKSTHELRSSNQMERFEEGSVDETLFGGSDLGAHGCGPEKKQSRDRKMKEWWKEEYFAEISKKKKKRRKKNKCEGQSPSNEMWSGDLFSKELSSTTSMRGTVCYVAPENGGFGHLMEKADIYSFGVLVLVVVSGRRPLDVSQSPLKLERANLITWCRQVAQTGNSIEILDEKLRDSCNKEQFNLCVNLALLCLQRVPDLRPDSGDIVKILKGEMELPPLPVQSSPSPNCRFFSRSRRRAMADAE
ncbi:Putative receptor-like protein kinase [Apostasia shenzhenica]|uniref:Receptor-like protein kinase n=1 Tax=Apostasia shenzhenica TaxID=1088818 RepID=A0A2I0B845_9ASPA|nr:Putative receptor-like protein kinase [Apostasia shenzhenica]